MKPSVSRTCKKNLDQDWLRRRTGRLVFAQPLLLAWLLLLLFAGGPAAFCAGWATARQTTGCATAQQSAAEKALLNGYLDDALADARQITTSHPDDGAAYLLICRSYYAEEHANQAIAACAKAVRRLPQSSAAEDWLGRAEGMAANAAGPISGLSLALKVKAAFEAAVALDPRNGAAVNDLSEFYVDAPALLGGGLNKALALADRVQSSLPQQAARIRALVAEKQKDYPTAEREFQAATTVANQPAAWVDLGAFYRRRGQYDKAVAALHQALALDHDRDASVVDVASLLGKMQRETEVQQTALQQYLQGGARSDAAPAVKVYVMLGEIRARLGDAAGAKIDFEKALTMAAGYLPAQRALQQLS
ncbi:MAG: tetratricopeptide repeat protein [Acidobacteriaceae bacterium]